MRLLDLVYSIVYRPDVVLDSLTGFILRHFRQVILSGRSFDDAQFLGVYVALLILHFWHILLQTRAYYTTTQGYFLTSPLELSVVRPPYLMLRLL